MDTAIWMPDDKLQPQTREQVLDSKTKEFYESELERIVDPETGIVCYHFTNHLSCVKALP